MDDHEQETKIYWKHWWTINYSYNYNDSIFSTHNHKPSDVFFERIDLEPIIEKKTQRRLKIAQQNQNSIHMNYYIVISRRQLKTRNS